MQSTQLFRLPSIARLHAFLLVFLFLQRFNLQFLIIGHHGCRSRRRRCRRRCCCKPSDRKWFVLRCKRNAFRLSFGPSSGSRVECIVSGHRSACQPSQPLPVGQFVWILFFLWSTSTSIGIANGGGCRSSPSGQLFGQSGSGGCLLLPDSPTGPGHHHQQQLQSESESTTFSAAECRVCRRIGRSFVGHTPQVQSNHRQHIASLFGHHSSYGAGRTFHQRLLGQRHILRSKRRLCPIDRLVEWSVRDGKPLAVLLPKRFRHGQFVRQFEFKLAFKWFDPIPIGLFSVRRKWTGSDVTDRKRRQQRRQQRRQLDGNESKQFSQRLSSARNDDQLPRTFTLFSLFFLLSHRLSPPPVQLFGAQTQKRTTDLKFIAWQSIDFRPTVGKPTVDA